MTPEQRRARAKHFIVLLGWVSLFADLCYEGMRSATGPYLELLRTSATAVGFVSGTGELVGFALRFWSGRLADRTQAYWAITIAGYACNVVAVPLLALAGSWPLVAALVGLERFGKAVRSPAKSTLTSFAATDLGAGKAFAVNEAMDQIGGMAGPLLVAGVLFASGATREGYVAAFVVLAAPALAAVGVLLRARRLYPDPAALEREAASDAPAQLGPRYRIYLAGVALIALGLADWPLIAFHFQRTGAITGSWLAVAYAGAMAVDGVVALTAGLWFDRARARGGTGTGVIAAFVAAGAAYSLAAFGSSASTLPLALAGIALWSVARSATESIGKAMIAVLVPRAQRGRAYGVFYLVYGGAWFVGSVLLGRLWDVEPLLAGIAGSTALIGGAVIVLWSGARRSTTRA
jgi:hypothetical protein